MAIKWPDKTPDAVKDYAIDWSERLAAGETITTSTWVTSSAELTIESGSLSPTIAGGVTTVWLSGGVSGTQYNVTNHIITSRGMEDDKAVSIRVLID
jgi:hypothetical protein